jgi:Uma2 family endonuclease
MDAVVLKDRFSTAMTDEEFLWFCTENKDLRIERNSHLEIIIMSPVTSLSGSQSLEVARQLANWAIQTNKGVAFDSSAGFTLADRSVLSPDASWVSLEKWNALSEEDKDRFAPICPEFVIELRSKSDNIEDLKEKMVAWLKNGAQLAWLIDPRDGVTYIFRPGKEAEKVTGFDKKIEGEGPVKGFVLDLSLMRI